MDNNKKTENFIILLVSLSCIGLTVESFLMGWEFWVPPIIILATILVWAINITERLEFRYRKILYIMYAMFCVFFHGVHPTSFFDVAIIIMLTMSAYSFFNEKYMMNLFLAEFVVIMAIQLNLSIGSQTFDPLNISRLILHFMVVILIYFTCTKAITDRIETEENTREKDDQIERFDADMEDFLSNISHELRTPVNVVNGMSDHMIKNKAGNEAFSIKEAGIRLACHIEDIQDYTECKRNKIMLEEEEYMSTSLINDVVTSFRRLDNNDRLELIVDMSLSVPTKMIGDIRMLHNIFRHLLDNAVKFTRKGGIYIKLYTDETEYGVNLCIEMTDTGIGMDKQAIYMIKDGMYQANKKRNRSSGGIGLGLYIVYGFAHRMGGFVKIESEKNVGTTVRVTVPQKVADKTPCLALSNRSVGDILFHTRSDKYIVPRVREFYRTMATDLASSMRVSLYSTETVSDIEHLLKTLNVTHIFMGQGEYSENPEYFEKLASKGVLVIISANPGFRLKEPGRIMIMPKPLYAYPIIKILNEGADAVNIDTYTEHKKPQLKGLKALIVDDEPMNLVVATSLFSEYEMIIDTASGGKEAIRKFKDDDYDIIFMDHMMPEMDGVEAMKRIRETASEMNKKTSIVALTANAVSGAREMFIQEGFDGFIAKPIDIPTFERVMLQVLPESGKSEGGERS